MQNEQFAIAIRFWKPETHSAPEIICVCRRCLNFSIWRDTYGLHQWITQHASYPCAAKISSTEIPDLIEKALATRMQDEPPAPPKAEIVDAVDWILKDASVRPPEMIGPVAKRWLDRLAEAYKK